MTKLVLVGFSVPSDSTVANAPGNLLFNTAGELNKHYKGSGDITICTQLCITSSSTCLF